VWLGASALVGAGLARRGAPEGALAPLALGAAGALASTSLSARLLRRPARVLRSLLPFALYRLLLAGVLLARPRRLKRAQ
jgi:hypothetical protein